MYAIYKNNGVVGMAPVNPSAELMHWKYKRKYRGPSGDWVYVYDDNSMSEKGAVTIRERSATNRGTHITEKVNTYTTNPDRMSSTERKTAKENNNMHKMNLQRKISESKKVPEEKVKSLLKKVGKQSVKKRLKRVGKKALKLGKWYLKNRYYVDTDNAF